MIIDDIRVESIKPLISPGWMRGSVGHCTSCQDISRRLYRLKMWPGMQACHAPASRFSSTSRPAAPPGNSSSHAALTRPPTC